jgi:insulysin
MAESSSEREMNAVHS